MFCPNCGKDCGDANFCPGCGKDLREKTAEQSFEEKREALRASGQVYCPSCLSTSVTVYKDNAIENEYLLYRTAIGRLVGVILYNVLRKQAQRNGQLCVCLKCDYRWYPKLFALGDQYDIHIAKLMGNHSGVNCPGIDGVTLRLERDRLTIKRPKGKAVEIRYMDLAAVDHREGVGPAYGRITVHDKLHRRWPYPKTLKAAQKDRFTILYQPNFGNGYRKICSTLRAIVEENKKAGLL